MGFNADLDLRSDRPRQTGLHIIMIPESTVEEV
jgi:hypothetical protein